MSTEDDTPPPGTEERLTALVLGEASASERAELDRLLGADPSLRALHDQLAEVHSALASSESKEGTPGGWKLPEKRRKAVLKGFAQNHPTKAGGKTKKPDKPQPRWAWIGAAAAATVAALLVVPGFFSAETGGNHPIASADTSEFGTTLDRFGRSGSNNNIDQGLSQPLQEQEILEGLYFDQAEIASTRSSRPATATGSTRPSEQPSSSQVDALSTLTLESVTAAPQPAQGDAIDLLEGQLGEQRDGSESARAWTFGTTGGDSQMNRLSTSFSTGTRSPEEERTRSERQIENFGGQISDQTNWFGYGGILEPNPPDDELQTRTQTYAANGKEIVREIGQRTRVGQLRERVRYSGEIDGLRRDIASEQEPQTKPGAGRILVPLSEPAPGVSDLEIATSTEPFSTFSLNVSDVSFKLAKAALLEKGEWPDETEIRPEEFVNAFDYSDPAPAPGAAVSHVTEQCVHPFLPGRNLLRVALRTAATGRASSTPLRLTVLLDKSGSMEREDREASVAKAVEALADQLEEGDEITVIGFARTPRLIADRLSGKDAGQLAKLVADAPSEGGTNLEEALRLAGEAAERQFLEGAVNRIVLVTDGAANLGDAAPGSLQEKIVSLRGRGIAFDACGVGADGLNDEVLEALTRKGDGRYYFLDRPEDADAGFVRQLAGALRPAARNVKVQVKFNPERVPRYRLSGFEKHRLDKEDFRDDAVDAAELSAAESGNAVYQIEIDPEGQGDVGEVSVRFQDTATGEMVERTWPVPYYPEAPALDEAPPTIQLAAVASLFAEKLKGGPLAGLVDLDRLTPTTSALRGRSPETDSLVAMIEKARALTQ